jgi:hypothetical protein
MQIPASLLTHVKTIDVAAAKAAQGPLSADLAAVAEKIRIAPERTTAAESIANFQPRANHRLEHAYNAVRAGQKPVYPLDNVAEAKSTASGLVESLQQYADAINKYGHGDLTPGGAYTPRVAIEDQLNDTMRYLEIRNKDNVEHARMRLIVDAALVKNTFGVDGSIFSVEDGKVTINEFDMEYKGNVIARSLGDGTTVRFNEDGTLSVDKRV